MSSFPNYLSSDTLHESLLPFFSPHDKVWRAYVLQQAHHNTEQTIMSTDKIDLVGNKIKTRTSDARTIRNQQCLPPLKISENRGSKVIVPVKTPCSRKMTSCLCRLTTTNSLNRQRLAKAGSRNLTRPVLWHSWVSPN